MVSTLMVNIKHTIIPVLHLPIRMMSLTPLHSERQKLCRVLAVLSAKGLKKKVMTVQSDSCHCQEMQVNAQYQNKRTGPSYSKLMTSLVNVSLNFQKLIPQMCQYFLLKKCEKLLQCKSFSHFFNKKF